MKDFFECDVWLSAAALLVFTVQHFTADRGKLECERGKIFDSVLTPTAVISVYEIYIKQGKFR